MQTIKFAIKKTIDTIKSNKISVALYILLVVLLAVVFTNKINVSLDEIYSYGLANYTKGLNLVVQENYKYEPAAGAYMEYVSATDRFNYANVWKNQANDVHPPLYYALMHTVCSIFPGSFSIWYGAVINIFFSLATLLFVQLLAWELSGKNKRIVLAVSAAFVLCGGILYANAFIRMYIMAMCFAACISWLIVKQTGENKTKFFFPALFAAAVWGALTHYYCIIYMVAVCGVYFVYLLAHKNFKQAGLLVVTAALAAGAATGIFPAMIQHIFFSYRGEESFSNIGAADMSRYTRFFRILSENLFGGVFALVIAVIVVLAVAVLAKKGGKGTDSTKVWQYIMVIVPSAVYFVLVSTVAVYITNRYVIPIYGVLLCVVFCMLFALMENLLDKKKFTACALAVVVAVSAATYTTCYKNYQYKSTQQLLDFAQQHSNLECLYLFDGVKFRMMPSFKEVTGYKNVTFVNYTNEGFLWSVDYSANDELVLTVVGADENAVNEVLKEYPQFTHCDEIGDFGYATTYHLHG